VKTRRWIAAAAAVFAVAGVLPAGAAGDTTHALMADRSRGFVKTPALAALLAANRDPFLSGALYPDSGYVARDAQVPGGDYGEVSHWENFINAYVAHIRSKPECAAVTNPTGPCAPMIAHLLGAAAHGMGDEIWDWLFEPLATDHGEFPDHPVASGDPLGGIPPGSLINSIEYAMDMIAIKDHFLWAEIPHYVPPAEDLVAVYSSIGRDDISTQGIVVGNALESAIIAAERFGAAVDGERVRAQMPWSSAHFYSESGGVIFSARAIAGYTEGLWRKLTAAPGVHPAPAVVAFHPEHNETGVPWKWHPALTSPGQDSGGGENRILVSLSNSVDPATVTPTSFILIGPDFSVIPPLAGFPKAGPWGPDGTHTILYYPAIDLQPCTQYTAVATSALKDHAGASLTRAASWSFVTRAADGVGSCE